MTPAGNLKHQAAVARTGERVLVLRTEIHEQLDVLCDLARKLEVLADARLTGGLGFLTPEGKELANKQARTDRAAARGMHRARGVGLKFLNSAAVLGTGQVEAPVTMPAVSASAAIVFTLRHHIYLLSKPALLLALEVEQTSSEDRGLCVWPRNDLVVAPPTNDGDVDDLARQLRRLVDVSTKHPRLVELLRELEHLEAAARDVVSGPAKTNHTDPCPWCGHMSLVVHHRVPGRSEMFISCDGTHRCVCDDETCYCHLNPTKSRHEWVNSGRAKNTIDGRSAYALTNLVERRKETARMETRALDALASIAALHQPTYTTADGTTHDFYVLVAGDDLEKYCPDHVCIDIGLDACQIESDDPASSLHSVPGCSECQTTTEDGFPAHRLWPCATYQATQLNTDSPNPKE